MRLSLVWLSVLLWPIAPAVGQRVQLRNVPGVMMPVLVDSNSPAYWRDGRFHLFNSSGSSFLSAGSDQFSLYEGSPQVRVDRADHLPMWIESVWQDSDGTLYAWYHHEPGGLCRNSSLTAPQIGALVSSDGGATFTDLGIVLASGDPIDCFARNGFFGGGHGDFSVILDQDGRYIYFLFDNYGGDLAGQGVAIARMAVEDRADPVGAVWKYYQGGWAEAGLGGKVSPVFPATVRWQDANSNALWGPSVHWNSYLQTYVVLLNHACCGPKWPQEGIYISFNPDLSNPYGWTTAQRVLAAKDIGFAPGYYPQVLGLGPEETDTLAGPVARLYVKGVSKWEIVFWPQ